VRVGHNTLSPVFSSSRGFCIDIYPGFSLKVEEDEIAREFTKRGTRPESRGRRLEGFAGCFGGSLVVVDLERRPLASDIPDPIYVRNEFIPRIVTVLETGRGIFSVKHIGRGDNQRFSLRKVKT